MSACKKCGGSGTINVLGSGGDYETHECPDCNNTQPSPNQPKAMIFEEWWDSQIPHSFKQPPVGIKSLARQAFHARDAEIREKDLLIQQLRARLEQQTCPSCGNCFGTHEPWCVRKSMGEGKE